ncbi:hypothetical protein LOD99_12348 [Oopsacas minuta]|uniref:Uncharacterized protein n=1 Tax=Oopsacas minuta TaxID=111878 RepID=A0AAV7JF14_9METZ|nr:hypothetical protein LOD99_12348 [Oopsacas minuta]
MNMKIWDYFIVLFVLFAVAYSNRCPAGWFNVTLSVTIDEIVSAEETDFFDPEMVYFKEILKFNDAEIEKTTNDAIKYFNRVFGLDFSNSAIIQGRRRFENAILYPANAHVKLTITHNQWALNGREGSRCFVGIEGGYQVLFLDNQLLYGVYGGEEGVQVTPGVDLIYNYFTFDFCPHTPTLVLCGSISPTFRDPYGFGIRHLECYNRELGRGLLTGAQGQLPTNDPDLLRLIIRHIFTFPATAIPGYLSTDGLF